MKTNKNEKSKKMEMNPTKGSVENFHEAANTNEVRESQTTIRKEKVENHIAFMKFPRYRSGYNGL